MNATDADQHADLREHIKSRLGEYDDVNLHLVSAHCNGAALNLTRTEALSDHRYEHTSTGTISNHDPKEFSWDADLVADTIIEVASMRGSDLAAEVEALLVPGEVQVVMAPAAHAHEFVHGQDWTECPAGQECEVYPRVYDISATKYTRGGWGASSSVTVDNPEDDIARGLLAARSALVLMDVQNDGNGLSKVATDALAQLNTTIARLMPRIYPDHT